MYTLLPNNTNRRNRKNFGLDFLKSDYIDFDELQTMHNFKCVVLISRKQISNRFNRFCCVVSTKLWKKCPYMYKLLTGDVFEVWRTWSAKIQKILPGNSDTESSTIGRFLCRNQPRIFDLPGLADHSAYLLYTHFQVPQPSRVTFPHECFKMAIKM